MIKCNETREKAVSNEEIKLHTKNQYQSEKMAYVVMRHFFAEFLLPVVVVTSSISLDVFSNRRMIFDEVS